MREGCGSTGSRLLRGERESFRNVERRFARFKGAGRALYFSSGYLANLAVMTTLAERYKRAGRFPTKYWTPEVHKAAFALPRFIAEHLARVKRR